jgi:tetratricopeptide (TPR) repeat protein
MGVTEEIIANLSKIENLKVISHTSVMRYRDTGKRLQEIAEELGVTNILEGSVRRAGERVRIIVQLIDAETALKTALRLNQGHSQTYHVYALLLTRLGRYEEALGIAKRGHDLDPLARLSNSDLAFMYLHTGQIDRAIETAEILLELHPEWSFSYEVLIELYGARRQSHSSKPGRPSPLSSISALLTSDRMAFSTGLQGLAEPAPF